MVPVGGDGGQQRVADAVLRDQRPHVRIQAAHGFPGQERLPVVQRERTLLRRQPGGGDVGRALDRGGPGAGLRRGLRRAVAQPGHGQGVGEPGHAQADPPLGERLLPLRLQREAGHVHGVVHHADGDRDQAGQLRRVDPGVGGERVSHQPGQVDGAEQAGAVGRQRLLAARVGGADGFAVVQVVAAVDAVDEDDAGLGVVVGGLGDGVEQGPGAQRAVDPAVEHQVPVAVGLHRGHERVGRQHGQVEVAQPPGLALGGDEVGDVRVVAAQGGHHGAAPGARGHDGAAHGVPHVHERQRAGGVGPHPAHRGAPGPQGGEVVADAAALLHGQGGLAQMVEDAAEVVGDVAHDEAVEQRHPAPGTGPRQDAAGRQEPEVLQRLVERLLPGARIGLGRGQGTRDPAPGVLHRAVHRRAVRRLEPVLGIPDLARNWGDGVGDARGVQGSVPGGVRGGGQVHGSHPVWRVLRAAPYLVSRGRSEAGGMAAVVPCPGGARERRPPSLSGRRPSGDQDAGVSEAWAACLAAAWNRA